MSLVACPKCATNLKIPDGAAGNVKCPKCTAIFAVATKPIAVPAFEVVDDTAVPPRPAPRPAPKPALAADFDFEVVDEPKPAKKKVVAAEDDDDDRPRSRRRRYDDDDDDDDRPRKKKKRRYDDEDDWRPAAKAGGGFAQAKVGMLLLSISFWLYLASFGLIALYVLIAWGGAGEPSSSSRPSSSQGGDSGTTFDFLATLPGIIGLANWIVALIGLGFCIAGPAKARGMAITATVLAAVHLILTGITFNNLHGGGAGLTRGFGGIGSPAWLIVASTLPFLDALLPVLFFSSRSIDGEMIVGILAGVCEVMRLVFALLTIKAVSEAAKDYDAGEKAQFGMIGVIAVVSVAMLLVLLVAVLIDQKAFKSFNTLVNVGLGTVFLVYLGYTCMMIMPGISALMAKTALGRRAR